MVAKKRIQNQKNDSYTEQFLLFVPAIVVLLTGIIGLLFLQGTFNHASFSNSFSATNAFAEESSSSSIAGQATYMNSMSDEDVVFCNELYKLAIIQEQNPSDDSLFQSECLAKGFILPQNN
jgi:hypothetical protein